MIADSIEQCVALSNRFAPEHLEIMTENNNATLESIEHAGSIFVGNYAPVPVGDYASGTNHVLPTAGYARMYSGLNIMHFLKVSSIQRISKEGLATIGDTVISLAEKEGYRHTLIAGFLETFPAEVDRLVSLYADRGELLNR